MASTTAQVRAKPRAAKEGRAPGGARRWLAIVFLGPALVLLGAIVIYPTIDTIAQSFQTSSTRQWVGLANYEAMIDNDRIVTAIKNNAVWVLSAPAIITGLGLVFAILTERVKYATAIKIVLFMPMAISFLSTGVIWRGVMYEKDPARGTINAAIKAPVDAIDGAGGYPTATVVPAAPVTKEGQAVVAKGTFGAGENALLPLVGMTEAQVPEDATQAAEPQVGDGAVGAVVWRDFKPGGGEIGVIEEGEVGLPGAEVQLLNDSGEIVGTQITAADGSVVFEDVGSGPFGVQVSPSTFQTGFTGIGWLSPSLVTAAIIAAFCWMWGGFSVVVVSAGLSALPRDVLEAARVDGASEWQTFRHVTLPLLAPVLGVVFVTMVINVLKIFDIVLVMAPGAVQDEANVLALELYKTAFTNRNYGLGSALAVFIFVLVIPAMILNIRRFRRDQ